MGRNHSPVHGSTGSRNGPKGEAPPGFFISVRERTRLIGRKAGFGRWIGRFGVGGGFSLGRDFRKEEAREGSRHRAGASYPGLYAAFSRPACLPKGKRAELGPSREGSGFQAGRYRGNPVTAPFPGGGQPYDGVFREETFRAGGNPGEAGKPKLPKGTEKAGEAGYRARARRRAPSGAPAFATGVASLPGEAMNAWDGQARRPPLPCTGSSSRSWGVR